MDYTISTSGAANEELARVICQKWIDTAARAGIDLGGFDAAAPLEERLAWARGKGLGVGTILSRFSSKMQHSTQSQVEDCVEFAAWHGIYVPPEFISVDEGVSGRKARRDGLDRCKLILQRRLAETLLVFKVSRLFRVAYKGYEFFQESVVEEGLRAISISQGIDTQNEKTWKGQAYLHGLMDEMLLETIADHVRSGLKSLFQMGFVTGAITVGYRAAEVPGGRPTNRGRLRTVPEVVPEVAEMIRQHYSWIRDGMPIRHGWRRWVGAGGPCDPRSTLGHMSYHAYRRMLANPRYTGRWAFGRKRNVWSAKRDYTRQMVQPETDVTIAQCEDLRIVDDDLFTIVQQRLAELRLGPRGPKKRKNVQLWDLITDLYYCDNCKVRFYQTGAHGRGMQCKHADLCPSRSAVRRDEAAKAVCKTLTELIERDTDLIVRVAARAQEIDAQGDGDLQAQAGALEKKIATLGNKVHDLTELAGQGTDADRAELKAAIRSALAERAAAQAESARLQKAMSAAASTLTAERVRAILESLGQLLEAAAAGKLGADMVYRAAAVFRQLVGDRIWVRIDRRPGRKQTNARGVFRPALLKTLEHEAGTAISTGGDETAEVEVWLRQPPKRDLLADRVHQLIDVEGMSYREAAAALQNEGHKINSDTVWQIYRRYYEMLGRPVPKRAYNNGRPRKSV